MSTCLGIEIVGARFGGAEEIATGVIDAAIRAESVGSIVLLASPEGERRFRLRRSGKIEVVEVTAGARGMGKVYWQSEGYRRLFRRGGVTCALFLGGCGTTDECVAKTIVIQQSLPFIAEGLGRLGPQERLRMATIGRLMKWSAESADTVVVQTETMRTLVQSELGCAPGAVRVLRLGVSRCLGAKGGGGLERSGASEKVKLLYVGNAGLYKGLGYIPAALRELRARGINAEVTATVERGVFCSGREDIREVGHLDRARLNAEYESAACLVMPSVSETVCLPLIEAMARGVAVAVADRPYAREVCGDAATYFEPSDPKTFADAVAAALEVSPEARARIVNGRLRAEAFSSPSAYDELIQAAVGSP